MTRTTRAAARTRELTEEATSTPLPATPERERVPLGEISENVRAEPAMVTITVNDSIKAGKKKGKQGKGVGKGNKKGAALPQEQDVVILEDDNQGSASSAVEETRTSLGEDTSEDAQMPLVSSNDEVTPSAAAETASKDLSLTSSEDDLRLDVQGLGENVEALDIQECQKEAKRSIEPKVIELTDIVSKETHTKTEEDSFVEQIRTRSPAKRISRIEDSVEALDALEDEIEKAAEAIPKSQAGDCDLTAKSDSKTAPTNMDHPRRKIPLNAPKSTKRVDPNKNDSRVKRPKPSVSAGREIVTPGTSIQAPTVSRSPISLRDINSAPQGAKKGADTRPRTISTKRVSSIHKAPFQPAKSTKEPTRASFELPGEAVARKLKEQREQRLKRDEEGKVAQRTSLKPRSIRVSQAPEIKMTAASKARLSIAKSRSSTGARTNPRVPSMMKVNPIQSRSGSDSKRSPPFLTQKAKETIKRPQSISAGNQRPSSAGARKSTLSPGAARAAPTAQDIAQQKQKGKALFSRPKNEIAERERVRKEKEDAAKKARKEAAERGRVASRHWAERQRERGAGK